jgi:hypothetical protein
MNGPMSITFSENLCNSAFLKSELRTFFADDMNVNDIQPTN